MAVPTDTSLRGLDTRSALAHLRGASDAVTAAALHELPAWQAMHVFEKLAPERREAVIRAAGLEGADLRMRHLYAEETVGRLMESAPAVFREDATVGSVVEALREVVKQRMVTYVFVVSADDELHGVVAFREIVFSEPHQPLADIMVRDPFFLTPRMPLVNAMREVVTRHYPIYPVCEPNGHLLGMVKGALLFEQQAFEISAQAGSMVGVEKEERLATPWLRSFRFRHPWLLVNLLTVFVSASVVGMFQDAINRVVVLAIFLPVMSGQCGNLGSQSLAVVLRGVTLGELRRNGLWPMVIKEGWVGFLNGLITGALAGAAMYWLAASKHEPAGRLAGAIMVAMAVSGTLSGMAGASIPIMLRRFGADPATASGIFLSTVTDVCSMGMFLGLASMLI
jgi:magnesium transporter